MIQRDTEMFWTLHSPTVYIYIHTDPTKAQDWLSVCTLIKYSFRNLKIVPLLIFSSFFWAFLAFLTHISESQQCADWSSHLCGVCSHRCASATALRITHSHTARSTSVTHLLLPFKPVQWCSRGRSYADHSPCILHSRPAEAEWTGRWNGTRDVYVTNGSQKP